MARADDTLVDMALQERFRIDAVNALHYATQLSSNAILSSGVDINSRDGTQSTALHGAVRVAGSDEAQQVVALMLSNGSDVNAKDEDGRTPLFFTCTVAAKIEIVELPSTTCGIPITSLRKIVF